MIKTSKPTRAPEIRKDLAVCGVNRGLGWDGGVKIGDTPTRPYTFGIRVGVVIVVVVTKPITSMWLEWQQYNVHKMSPFGVLLSSLQVIIIIKMESKSILESACTTVCLN